MSYYPTERRGGCMESISRCCRQAYVYPIDTRKLLYVAGGVVGVILVAVIWSGLSSSSTSHPSAAPLGSSVLTEVPLIVGCNFFPSKLRDLAHNQVSKVKFSQNLKNDSLLGNETIGCCQTDLPRLQAGLVGSQVWSINVPCDAMYKDAVAITLEQVDALTRLISSYPGNLTAVKSSTDVKVAFQGNEMGNILAVTSGHSIDGRLAVLRTLRTLGVRVMALTSNCNNSWAASYNATNDTGLSDFGKELVKEMNRLGILIDLSEASYKTQLDVLNITKVPVVFSHAAAYSLVNDSRNIKDDILDKLKSNEGVVMVTFAVQYISNNISNASISDVISHINYIKNRTGVMGVGIGAEFDAANTTYPPELSDVSTFPTLFDTLGKTWNDWDDLKKLASDNLIRVLQAVEKYARDSELLPVDETYMLQFNSSCYSDYGTRNNESNGSSTNPITVPPSPPTTKEPPQTTAATTPSTITVATTTNVVPASTSKQKAAAEKSKPQV